MRGKLIIVAGAFLSLAAGAVGGPGTLTYQGSLVTTGGQPVGDGTYRMRFSLCASESGGTAVWSETETAVAVRGGLFACTLGDGQPFGMLCSTQTHLWLEVAVDLNGSGQFEASEIYAPRQCLASAAWAVEADRLGGLAAGDFQRRVTGTAPAGSFITVINADGTVVSAVDQVGAGDITGVTAGTGLTGGGVAGAVTVAADTAYLQRRVTGAAPAGSFIRAINADGTVVSGADQVGSPAWALLGNGGLTAGMHFLGTTTNVPLELRTNNSRALRLEASAGAPNVIGGWQGNVVSGGVVGATIGGGGESGAAINQVSAHYGTVAGGHYNTAGGESSSVGGGWNNVAGGQDSTIGGGSANRATQPNATVAGGLRNEATSVSSTVGGGYENRARGWDSIVAGGSENDAASTYAVVSGGRRNHALNLGATVGGGVDNSAGGEYATIAGGYTNTATNYYATVGGGVGSVASGYGATVGGGVVNEASGGHSTVGGGNVNAATHSNATIGGGLLNTAGGIYTTIAGGASNTASGLCATVGGGQSNLAAEQYSTVAGGERSSATATHATVGGGTANRANGDHATIAGGRENSADTTGTVIGGGYGNHAEAPYATVAGGAYNRAIENITTIGGGMTNMASRLGSTIGGGAWNRVDGDYATIAGGEQNEAYGISSATGGGNYNNAGGDYSTISGGTYNEANGDYAMVAGGYGNGASGDGSFAAGHRAVAAHEGAFVWSDRQNHATQSTTINEFRVRATGGVVFVTGIDAAGNPNAGMRLASGGSGWLVVSDRNLKTDFEPVDTRAVLERVAALPMESWRYTSQDATVRHIGPMAQDFHAAFGLGEDELGINSIDADGVALAAIQGLYQMVRDKDAAVAAQQGRITALEARLLALEQQRTGE